MSHLKVSFAFVCSFASVMIVSAQTPIPNIQNEKPATLDQPIDQALIAGPVTRSSWGETKSGEPVDIYTLTNPSGLRAKIATYGATLVSLETPDREGITKNITLSYPDFTAAEAGGLNGNIVGRFANRIDTGGFTLDKTRFELETVNPKTKVHIHGGKEGLARQNWKAEAIEGDDWVGVRLTHTSPDGHEGYPGKVEFTVEYRLNENSLIIDYQATTTKPTHLNLTNHAYFNLSGDPATSITDHILEIKADKVLAVDERKIPTGEMISVKGTPYDFLIPHPVGEMIEDEALGGGYDHCFVGNTTQEGPVADPTLLSRVGEQSLEVDETVTAIQQGAGTLAGSLKLLSRITDPKSGRVMEVLTTQPGVQIYTANHMKDPKWPAICFETQHFPDSPNKPGFPSTVLRPDEKFHEVTIFRFGIAPEAAQ